MPPTPQFSIKNIQTSQWLLLGVLFLLLILYHCWQDIQQGYLNVFVDAYYHLADILAWEQPDTLKKDWLYGDGSMAKRAFIAYPAYLHALRYGIHHWGAFHTLSLFQGCLGMIYLPGAFCLLYALTGRFWASALIAALSAFPSVVFPAELRGVLSVGLVMPGTVFLAVSPWLFWAWLTFQKHPIRKRLLFLAQGLLGTVHPLSWGLVTFSMLFSELVTGRFQKPVIKEAFICFCLSLLPLLPFMWSWSQATAHQEGSAEMTTVLSFAFPASRLQYLWEHWEHALPALPWISLTAWAASRAWPKIPNLVLGFALGSMLLWLSFYGLNEWVWLPHHQIFVDGARSLKYLFLPGIIILALWLMPYQGTALLMRSGLIILLTTLLNIPLLVQDIRQSPLALPRHAVHQWLAFAMPPPPELVQSHTDTLAIAQWIQQHLPPQQTLIHVSVPQVLMASQVRSLGERSITLSLLDATLYDDKQKLGLFWNMGVQLEAWRRAYGYCSAPETQFALENHVTHLLCPANTAAIPLKRLYENASFRLYELPH